MLVNGMFVWFGVMLNNAIRNVNDLRGLLNELRPLFAEYPKARTAKIGTSSNLGVPGFRLIRCSPRHVGIRRQGSEHYRLANRDVQ
jgi:hypothetical protein